MCLIFLLMAFIFLFGYSSSDIHRAYSTAHEKYEDRVHKSEQLLEDLVKQTNDHEVRIRVLEKQK